MIAYNKVTVLYIIPFGNCELGLHFCADFEAQVSILCKCTKLDDLPYGHVKLSSIELTVYDIRGVNCDLFMFTAS